MGRFKRFKDKKISRGKFIKILEKGMEVFGVGDLLHWRLLVVEEGKVELMKGLKKQKWMLNACKWVLVCSDVSEVKRFFKKDYENLIMQDCAMVSQNMMLEADSLKVGNNFVRSFDEDKVREILRIPDSVFIFGFLVFGVGDGVEDKLVDFDLDNFVYFDKYGAGKRDSLYPVTKFFKKK